MSRERPELLVPLLRSAFHDPTLTAAQLTLLGRGRYANANVYRCETGGRTLVVKEFRARGLLVRTLAARLLIRREYAALTALAGLPGIPGAVQRLGPHVLAMAWIEGPSLVELKRSGRHLPKAFFLELEQRVAAMHRAGYVHLDLRNLGNVLCASDGQPWLLDFQSCVATRHLPAWLRTFLENIDHSGVYKDWSRVCSEPLDPEREQFLAEFNRVRRFWVFRGYWLHKQLHRLHGKLRKAAGSGFPASH